MEIKIYDPYEIVATIREVFKNGGDLIFSVNDFKVRGKIQDMNFKGFSVLSENLLIKNIKYRVEIFSNAGVIIFESKAKGDQYGNIDSCVTFIEMPTCIFLSQRRQYKRIDVLDLNYKCAGIFKDGTQYVFCVKNISEGGCAVISMTPLPRYNKILKHVSLTKDECIKIAIIDMEVKNSIKIDGKGAYTYMHSFQFIFKKSYDKNKIEKEIMLIESRNRNRNRNRNK